jgi:hypothetical protein
MDATYAGVKVEIVSHSVQSRASAPSLFSSAVFCLWLSTASLLPALDLVAPASSTVQSGQIPQIERVAEPS